MSVEPLARILAGYCASLRGEALPAAVRDAVGTLLLDYLGNALGGGATDSARSARRFLRAQGLAGRSVVLGAGTAPAQYAALVNGVGAHSLEMDDTHQPSSLHPGVTVFAAALAALGEAPEAEDRFEAAVAAGYEVTCRIGMALDPAAHYERGFHPTATAGVFGATAAAGMLLGLSTDELTSVLGIAGSMAAGSMEFLAGGAWTKRLHPGWAAHSGILAARLAQAGYTGPATVLEGRNGFLRAYSPVPRPDAVTEDLGAGFEILRTSVKAHACCRYKQAPIDGILALLREHALTATDVERVEIGVMSAAWDIIAAPEEAKRAPRTVVDAQFSMPYGAAVALLYGRASPAEYEPAMIRSPEVRAAMARVHCVRDPALDRDYPRRWPASVQVRTFDGRLLTSRVDFPKGYSENPLSPAELEAKFRLLAAPTAGPEQQDRIVAAVRAVSAPGGPLKLLDVLGAGFKTA